VSRVDGTLPMLSATATEARMRPRATVPCVRVPCLRVRAIISTLEDSHSVTVSPRELVQLVNEISCSTASSTVRIVTEFTNQRQYYSFDFFVDYGDLAGGFERDAFVCWTLFRMVLWVSFAGFLHVHAWYWVL
jgi:hypothetical protein